MGCNFALRSGWKRPSTLASGLLPTHDGPDKMIRQPVPSVLSMVCVSSGCPDDQLRPSFLRPRLPPELLLNRLHDEVHEGDLVGHAVQLEPAVKLLRDAGRQLRPGFVCRRHLRRLGLRSGRTPWTAPTPATAATVLRLRGCGRHHGALLPVPHLLGNRFRRTTGTTWVPSSPRLATAPTVLSLQLRAGDTSE